MEEKKKRKKKENPVVDDLKESLYTKSVESVESVEKDKSKDGRLPGGLI